MEHLLLTLGGLTLGGSGAVLALSFAGRVSRGRYGARWRCWAWLLLCLRLALPLPLLPQMETQAPIRVELPSAPAPVQPLPPPAPDESVPPPPVPETPPIPSGQEEEDGGGSEAEETRPAPSLSPAQAAVGVWLLGAAGMLGWSALSHLRFLAYLRRWSAPVRDGEVIDAFRRAGDLLELELRPRLLVCQGLQVPMLAGALRPALLLPQREDWTREELSCSLLHELTHCRRRDIWLKALAIWVNALHWFNPLMWYMVRAVERDTELACDEDVLRRLPPERRAAYGKTILTAAEKLNERKTL